MGATLSRVYEVAISNPSMSPEEAFKYLKAHFPEFVPSNSVFQFDLGRNERLDVGDEVFIDQLDPIFGSGIVVKSTSVFVSNETSDSFTFVTKAGHPEAGAIKFSVTGDQESLLVKIESETTAGSYADAILYTLAGKVLQTDIWGNFLLHSARTFSTNESQALAGLTANASTQPIHQIAPSRQDMYSLSIGGQ